MQFSQNFNKVLNTLYKRQEKEIISNISKKVDDFFDENEELSILLKNKNISVDSIVSKISNETLNDLLDLVISDLFNKYKKFNLGVAFNYNNYIIYLVKELEKEGNNGSILAIKFLKKLQPHTYPKNDVLFNYDLVFSDKEILVGYRYSDVENKCLEFIQKSYYEVILEDLSEKILNNKKVINDDNVNSFLKNLINRQNYKTKNMSYFYIHDLSIMLKYAYIISINDNPISVESALDKIMLLQKGFIK